MHDLLQSQQWAKFEEKYGHLSWFNDRRITLNTVITESVPNMFNWSESVIFSIKRLLIVFENSNRSYREIKAEFDEWRTGIVSNRFHGSDHVPNGLDVFGYEVDIDDKVITLLPDYNFMSALFIPTKLLPAFHVEIVSPLISMKEFGPQIVSGDSVCLLKKNNTSLNRIFENVESTDKHGACVAWSEIYTILGKNYRPVFSYVDDLIIFLRENPYIGMDSPMELLGRVMYDRSVDTREKVFNGCF
ncbi:MAG: hypothetical protein ABJQ96_16950 [Crocinitomicaceae bacterium]